MLFCFESCCFCGSVLGLVLRCIGLFALILFAFLVRSFGVWVDVVSLLGVRRVCYFCFGTLLDALLRMLVVLLWL